MYHYYGADFPIRRPGFALIAGWKACATLPLGNHLSIIGLIAPAALTFLVLVVFVKNGLGGDRV
jgi:hypothetical protein